MIVGEYAIAKADEGEIHPEKKKKTRPPLEPSSSRRKAADCRSVPTPIDAQSRTLYVQAILRFF